MLKIFVALMLGVFVGAVFKFSDKQVEAVSKLQTVGVVVLLFIMGISVGINPEIISKLSEIGFKALAYAVGTTTLSILAVYLVTNRFVKKENIND